jgi:hypothetical protein
VGKDKVNILLIFSHLLFFSFFLGVLGGNKYLGLNSGPCAWWVLYHLSHTSIYTNECDCKIISKLNAFLKDSK